MHADSDNKRSCCISHLTDANTEIVHYAQCAQRMETEECGGPWVEHKKNVILIQIERERERKLIGTRKILISTIVPQWISKSYLPL